MSAAVETMPAETAPAPKPRQSTMEGAAGFLSGALALDDTDWHVRLQYDFRDGSGSFTRYLTVAQARELAAALIRSADHHDAETARLAQQVAA